MLILNLTLYNEQTETSKTFMYLPQNFVTRGITNFHSRSSIFYDINKTMYITYSII